MVSEQHRFCFIHIPKTGGNSIQNSLAGYSEDRVVCISERQDGKERFEIRRSGTNLVKHSTINDYKREISPSLFDNLVKFSVVRNPFDRVISFYFSPHRGDNIQWDRNEFIILLNSIRTDEEFLCYNVGENYVVDRLLRFESLQSDFSELLLELNLPVITLPKRNRSLSKKTSNYRIYYDEELKELVGLKFKRTIDDFGYKF